MAWAHFTALLEPGDVITIDQRNELLDALDERLAAGGKTGDGVHADMDAVRSSDIDTTKLKYTWLESTTTALRVFGVLEIIAPRFARTTDAPDAFTESTFRADIETVLGVGAGAVDAAWQNYPLASALAWNAFREGLRLLKTARIPLGNTGWASYNKTSGATFTTWAAAKTAYLADAEALSTGSSTNLTRVSGNYYLSKWGVGAYRAKRNVAIPSGAVVDGAGYSAWTFHKVNRDTSPVFAPAVVVFALAGEEASYSALTENERMKSAVISGLTSTGTVEMRTEYAAWDDSVQLDDFDPGTGGNKVSAFSYDGTELFFAPVFTHP